MDFVKAILICLIYGNPDRVWSCLREARGDQDGMVWLPEPVFLDPRSSAFGRSHDKRPHTPMFSHHFRSNTQFEFLPQTCASSAVYVLWKTERKFRIKVDKSRTLQLIELKEFYDAKIIERRAAGKLESTGMS